MDQADQNQKIWYFEENGLLQGPYSKDELIEFLLQGRLKVELKVYNPQENQWFALTDLIPALETEITRKKSSPNSAWLPPPKPIEISKNLDSSAQLDQIITKETNYFSVLQKKLDSKKKPSQTSNDLSYEEDSQGINQVLAFLDSHKKTIFSAAAGIAVFALSFSLLKNFQSPKREIATSTTPSNDEKNTAIPQNIISKPKLNTPNSNPTSQNIGLTRQSKLGTGETIAAGKRSGAVSLENERISNAANQAQLIPPIPNPNEMEAQERERMERDRQDREGQGYENYSNSVQGTEQLYSPGSQAPITVPAPLPVQVPGYVPPVDPNAQQQQEDQRTPSSTSDWNSPPPEPVQDRID
jgi:hypothetical protein